MAAKRSRSSGWRTTWPQNSKNTASQPSSRSRRSIEVVASQSNACCAPAWHRPGATSVIAVERRDDGAFLGMCGLHHQQSYPDDVEVAWRLARGHWGHGYATEAATGWLDHGFGTLDLPRVISMTDRPNLRSLAVMRRLGMVFDHEAEVEDMGMVFQAVVYVITAEQWRGGAAARRRGVR
jgi:RimJ/RimL family protein N-acetyltransferase